MIGKERLKKLVNEGGDRVEILALAHSLMARFQDDPDVQQEMGNIYLRMGNIDRAAKHYSKMYELDGLSRSGGLRYASFLMQHGDANFASQILSKLTATPSPTKDEQAEIYWLQANFHARNNQFQESQELLNKVLAIDPWNASYLVQQTINLSKTTKIPEEFTNVDKVVKQLAANNESQLDWRDFDRTTNELSKHHAYDLIYTRCKLRYLYSSGDEQALRNLITSACKFDAGRGTYDFLRLLNTNFDSPSIYWGLGILFKELWQLETACMWLEQALLYPNLDNTIKAKIYVELADCYTWRHHNLTKAIEYTHLAIEMGERGNGRASAILAHALLRNGQVRQAETYLEHDKQDTDPEIVYLRGLVQYRNGSRSQANKIWKPLLTVRSDSLRFHHIKQEILRFYFQGDPYMKAN